MARSRLWIAVAMLTLAVGVAPSAPGGAAQSDNGLETQDRRGAALAATNIFVGQVVGEQLICSEASGPGHVRVHDRFTVKVERNVKGRVEGTTPLEQSTDDTGQYGPDGRLVVGAKYLFLTRDFAGWDGIHRMVDSNLGYVRIDGPEQRAALVAEVTGYLAAPTAVVDTPTPIPPDTRATWDANGTRLAATMASEPTPGPCEPWVIATATAAGDALARDNRALGPIFGPGFEWATPAGT